MKDVNWDALSDLVEMMIKTKDDWRKEFSTSSVPWIENLISNIREYWKNIDVDELGVFARLIKERCIEIAEMGEAELLQRGNNDD